MEGADFFVEGLLDFSNGGDDMITDAFFHSTDSSSLTPVSDSCNSSGSGSGGRLSSFPDSHFSNDLCVPCDELEELEWLSNFVEESFSTEELHKFHLIPTHPSPTQYPIHSHNPNPTHQNPSTVPGKARSKRSRIPPCDWSTRLLMVSPQTPSPATSSSSGQNPGLKKPVKRREAGPGPDTDGEARRCLHCAAEKTPQWRTGPMGPKTLCNACGVRYKSGRLVPEYRPAASPTFVSAKHSNSHRKVMELRRQKEVQMPQHSHFIGQHQQHHHRHHQSMMMGVSNGGDDYLIHHLAHDYRQMMS
ncbi:hypothetical protein RND81_14G159500 [Saponaria officinalis]|uniref:GATA transcription factor n=1 Tax=Saponaria officinalis TaxID=3572 RepID=A0AAW1GR29_SAPOF